MIVEQLVGSICKYVYFKGYFKDGHIASDILIESYTFHIM